MPTHGSLTKAGKVRNQTPGIESTKRKKRPSLRINNLQNMVEYSQIGETSTEEGEEDEGKRWVAVGFVGQMGSWATNCLISLNEVG